MRRNNGFFMTEGMVGLGILGLAATVLIVGISRQSLAYHVLADSRAATRAAEATLLRMQAGLPASDSSTNIASRALPEPAPVKGFHWVEVRATAGEQTRFLVGLVPDQLPKTDTENRSTP